jgi:hypothetical protein
VVTPTLEGTSTLPVRRPEGTSVVCKECGERVPEAANFCPACGARITGEHEPGDTTTASIDIGALDPHHDVGELPDLAPGTGMLVVVRGPNAGSRYLLDREETTVGRHPDADIFLDDVTVSRRHATLTRGQGVLLTDHGSLNGTYVNGDRVDERVLATGDELQVGRFKLLFVGAPGGDAGPPGLA